MTHAHPKLDHIRNSLRRALPGVKSSHVAEAVARALGHRTNAALLAALETRPERALHVNGPDFVEALTGFGYEGISVYDVSRALPWQERTNVDDGYVGLSSQASSSQFARFAATNQALIACAVAIVFPGLVDPSVEGVMNSGAPDGAEPWQRVGNDCIMLGMGRGNLADMAHRIAGWCILADTAARALALDYLHDPDFRPATDIAQGGWKAGFRDAPVPRHRAWDDETNHDGGLPRLMLPWPGHMGAKMPFDGAHRFALAAGCSDVIWFPDKEHGRRLYLTRKDYRIALPDDPEHEAVMRPLLDTGYVDHGAEAPGLPDGHLRISINRTSGDRCIVSRLIMPPNPANLRIN